MKLVKLLSRPLSSVAGIVGIPNAEDVVIKRASTKAASEATPTAEGGEEKTPQKSLLISDDRFTLLKQNHVKTHLVKDFSEVAVAGIGDFDKNKTYVIADIVKPSEFSNFKPEDYTYGDYVFVYADGPKFPGCPPIMRKPEPGFMFTPKEYDAAKKEYDEAMQKYNEALETYATELETFMTKEAELKEFGWLIQVLGKTQYKVVADFSFETTKDSDQFGIFGKLPKEVATKITKAIGGFESEDSIKGVTLVDIIKKAFGLEPEEDVVGQVVSTEGSAEGESDPAPTETE